MAGLGFRRFLAGFALALLGACTAGCGARARAPGRATAPPATLPPVSAREVAARFDAEMSAAWAAKGLVPVGPATDLEVLRRLSLDLVGRIPTLAEIEATRRAAPGERRGMVVERALGSAEFAEYRAWTLLDLLAGGSLEGRGFVRPALHAYLAGALGEGKGYDEIVTALLTAEGDVRADGAAAYLALSRGEPTAMAASVADHFLGIDIACAQCHNHPFAAWKQEDFWALTAFFARTELLVLPRPGMAPDVYLEEVPRGEVRMGMETPGAGPLVPPRFPDHTPGPLDPRIHRRRALAEWLTAADNPYFARNRVLQLLESMLGTRDIPGPGVELLSGWYVASGYDEAALVRAIALTELYGLSSRPAGVSSVAARVRALTLRQVARSMAVAAGLGEVVVPPGAPGEDLSGRDPLSAALERMGRSARGSHTAIEPSAAELSLVRSLFLQNGRLVDGVVQPFDGGTLRALLDSARPLPELVDEVYLRCVARAPSPAERAEMVAYLRASPSLREGWSDLLWALFNSSDFLFNL